MQKTPPGKIKKFIIKTLNIFGILLIIEVLAGLFGLYGFTISNAPILAWVFLITALVLGVLNLTSAHLITRKPKAGFILSIIASSLGTIGLQTTIITLPFALLILKGSAASLVLWAIPAFIVEVFFILVLIYSILLLRRHLKKTSAKQ